MSKRKGLRNGFYLNIEEGRRFQNLDNEMIPELCGGNRKRAIPFFGRLLPSGHSHAISAKS